MRSTLLLITFLDSLLLATFEDVDLSSIISKINSDKSSTWKAGRNPKTEELLQKLIRAVKKEKHGTEGRSSAREYDVREYETIARSFDARKKWPQCASLIGHVRSQGKCGSSWAIQASSLLGDRICIESNGTRRIELSAEHLLDCCSDCLFDRSNVCGGGHADRALRFLNEQGAVTETCKPYSMKTYNYRTQISCVPTCKLNMNKSEKYKARSWYKVSPIKNVTRIQEEICTHGPVEARLDVYNDFLWYRKGIYRYSWGKFLFTQHVKIIGWGEKRHRHYWLCVNSWGTRWGEVEGLFRISRGINSCGIESQVHAATHRRIAHQTSGFGSRRTLSIVKCICVALVLCYNYF